LSATGFNNCVSHKLTAFRGGKAAQNSTDAPGWQAETLPLVYGRQAVAA
jgi:hypothetical protein